MSNSPKNLKAKRKRVFVDRQVQGALAKHLVLHWCAYMFVTGVCVWAFEVVTAQPGSDWRTSLLATWENYGLFWIILVAMVPSFLYDTLKVSQRFAGPILRFRRSLRAAADGESVASIRFRDGDYWHELANDFNRLLARIEALEQRHRSVATDASADDSRLPSTYQSACRNTATTPIANRPAEDEKGRAGKETGPSVPPTTGCQTDVPVEAHAR
ncbi:MAG: hypothetical protein KatS3mg111_2181 [Pirellulaceae bacterium]|nr:MAG: hypothetical protein KatS3mg111_2181 [Pirellulaceae bacterium]